MVTIGMNYNVIEGKRDAFIAMFNKVIEVMAGIPGHKESHLYVDINNANAFLIISEWSRKADFDAFVASETFAKVATWGREQILAGRPRHNVYGTDD